MRFYAFMGRPAYLVDDRVFCAPWPGHRFIELERGKERRDVEELTGSEWVYRFEARYQVSRILPPCLRGLCREIEMEAATDQMVCEAFEELKKKRCR